MAAKKKLARKALDAPVSKKPLRNALVSLAPKKRAKRRKPATVAELEARIDGLEAVLRQLSENTIDTLGRMVRVHGDSTESLGGLTNTVGRIITVIDRSITTETDLVAKSVDHEERIRALERKPKSKAAAKWGAAALNTLSIAAKVLKALS